MSNIELSAIEFEKAKTYSELAAQANARGLRLLQNNKKTVKPVRDFSKEIAANKLRRRK